jgi:2'-5' RNA ligase
MVRCFIAIDLSASVKEVLRELGHKLRNQIPRDSVRWGRVSGIHLTLQFLGDVAESDLSQIEAVLVQVSQRHVPFTFTVGDLGCFPNLKKPRVVWVGVQEETGALTALQKDVVQSLVPLGFEPERRAFRPHLTLGRARRDILRADQRRLGEVIAAAGIGELGRVDVGSFLLMRSDLRPDGAVYSRLAKLDLGLEQKGI